MTCDNLRIASFNASRGCLNGLAPQDRARYLSETLDASAVDICFLPGDDTNAPLYAVQGYSQFLTPGAKDTVLLYNNNRVEMKPQGTNLTAFGYLPGLDYSKMVVPTVTVYSPLPHKTELKKFNLIGWRYDLFQSSTVGPETLAESIIKFAQRLAASMQMPCIISGEINLTYETLVKIVKKLSKDAQESFLSERQPVMAECGFLPSMTNGSLKEQRHLFMMKAIKCERDGFRGTNNGHIVANCFIASKQLNLAEATLSSIEKVECRKISMSMKEPKSSGLGYALAAPALATLSLMKTTPKHHGG